MKRVFFEKDKIRDYLFLIVEPHENTEVYNVNNFTDETGREYVYTLIGERKKITDEAFTKNVAILPNGKFINYNGPEEVATAKACVESMIDARELNRDNDIYIYVRNK